MRNLSNSNYLRWSLIAGIAGAVLLFFYSVLGLLQALFLFGTGPNASVDRVLLNFCIWGGVMLLCLALIAYLFVKLGKWSARASRREE